MLKKQIISVKSIKQTKTYIKWYQRSSYCSSTLSLLLLIDTLLCLLLLLALLFLLFRDILFLGVWLIYLWLYLLNFSAFLANVVMFNLFLWLWLRLCFDKECVLLYFSLLGLLLFIAEFIELLVLFFKLIINIIDKLILELNCLGL